MGSITDRLTGPVAERPTGRLAGGRARVSGGEPDWWPADSKVAIDFINDRAWTIEDGPVAISVLLGFDQDAEDAGWPGGEYDPADLGPTGYNQTTPAPAYIGRAKTRLLAGATTRFQVLSGAIGSGLPLFLGDVPGEAGIYVEFIEADSSFRFLSTGGAALDATVAGAFVPSQVNCLAITLTPTRGEAATNGSLIVTDTVDTNDWPTGVDPIAFGLINTNDEMIVQTITIYDALPSTAGLAALSTVI